MTNLIEQLEEANEVVIEDSQANSGQETEVKADSPDESKTDGLEELKTDSPEKPETSSEEPVKESTEQEELKVEGQETEEKPWYEEFGYKSQEEALKGHQEMRAMDTRLSQNNAELEKKLAMQDATIAQLRQFFDSSKEEVVEDPAIMELNEQLRNTPFMQEVATALHEIDQQNRSQRLVNEVSSFKSTHPDFEKLEPVMAEIMNGYSDVKKQWLMSTPGGYGESLDYLYKEARIESFFKEVGEKKELAASEKQKQKEQNRDNINIGGDAIGALTNGGGRVENKDKEFDGTLSYFTED